LIVVLAVDDDNNDANKMKLNTIAELIVNRYNQSISENRSLTTSSFEDFSQALRVKGIVQDNCGDYEDCVDCPNNSKSIPVKNQTHAIQNKWN
jgi:hypothetical protein